MILEDVTSIGVHESHLDVDSLPEMFQNIGEGSAKLYLFNPYNESATLDSIIELRG